MRNVVRRRTKCCTALCNNAITCPSRPPSTCKRSRGAFVIAVEEDPVTAPLLLVQLVVMAPFCLASVRKADWAPHVHIERETVCVLPRVAIPGKSRRAGGGTLECR